MRCHMNRRDFIRSVAVTAGAGAGSVTRKGTARCRRRAADGSREHCPLSNL